MPPLLLYLLCPGETLRIRFRGPTTPSTAPSCRDNSSLALLAGASSLGFLPHPHVSSILEASPAQRLIENCSGYIGEIFYQRITEESPGSGNPVNGRI